MSEPLKGLTTEGVPYLRPPAIEAWIGRLEGRTPEQRIEHFAARSRKHADYVPSEVLVYFLRRAWEKGDNANFEKMFRILMQRVMQSLRSAIPGSQMADAQGIREEISGRFAELIAEDCRTRNSTLDFYEIRFDLGLARFRISALRQVGPAADDTVPLEKHGEDGLEISPEVEVAAAELLGGSPSMLDDPAFRLALTGAIDGLPEDQKRVIGLLLQGLPIDSKDENVMTIARMLKCDERTVRNRRDRAFRALKPILEAEFTS